MTDEKSILPSTGGTEGMTKDSVKEYYSKHLKTSADLQTNACCTAAAPPEHIKKALAQIHDEVIMKYYGCGLCLPDDLEGLSVLDLGCGAGRDVYIASQLVARRAGWLAWT